MTGEREEVHRRDIAKANITSRSDVQDRGRIASNQPNHPSIDRPLPWLAGWLAGWMVAGCRPAGWLAAGSQVPTTPKAVHIQFEEPTSVQIIEQPRRAARAAPRAPSPPLCSLAPRSLKAKMGQEPRTPSTAAAVAAAAAVTSTVRVRPTVRVKK